MLVAIPPSNREKFYRETEEYFALRKHVLIDEMGWDLTSTNGLEIDQFDHKEAHYLLCKSEGHVYGGVRLTPTMAPNLTMEIFPHLMDPPGFEASCEVWEASRFVTKSCRGNDKADLIRQATMLLLSGMVEYGLFHDLRGFLVTTEIRMERILRMCEWNLQRLGSVARVGNTLAVVGTLEVREGLFNVCAKKTIGYL